MKKIFLFLLFILLIPLPVLSPRIEVNVKGKIGGNIEYFEMNETTDSLQKFVVQWYNSESANCRSRIEFKIYENSYNDSAYIKSIWSEVRDMTPGMSNSFEAYWIPQNKGNYSVKIIVHHCYEIIESDAMNFSVKSLPNREEIIDIEAENVPGRKIRVSLKSDIDMENVIIVPTDYPLGWIFNGERIDKVEAGETITKELEYEPSIWSSENINIQAVSLDGKYSSEKINFALKEEKYFWDEYGYIVLFLITALLVASVIINLYLFSRYKETDKNRKL